MSDTNELTLKLKKLHDGQKLVLAGAARFNVLKIGRRWGKTTLAVNELIPSPALDGFPVAYFSPTYNDMAEVWNELLMCLEPVVQSKNEQRKQIKLITGGVIDFWSMDNPDSGRGRKYARAVIDEAEKANKFKDSWQNTILPTLIDYGGDAWILSTPKFGETYFKELFRKGGQGNWAAFNLSTYSNPHIKHSEIEEVRATMDSLSFACEILAEDVNISLNPFCYAFDEKKHIAPVEYDPDHELTLAVDFNVDPLSAFVCQNYDEGHIEIIREYRLMNGNIYDLCDRLVADWPNATWLITGDATGQARSALTKGNVNYYTVIRQQLGLAVGQMKQPHVNPSIRDTRVLVNSIMQNGTFRVDPSCEWLIRDLKLVEVDGDGDILKDRRNDARFADFIDCLRYNCYTFHRKFIKSIGLSDISA